MPKIMQLFNQHISVERSSELDPEASEQNGGPVMVDVWTLIFTDRSYGDQIKIGVRKEARDAVVRDLTGGVILAGGDLPSV